MAGGGPWDKTFTLTQTETRVKIVNLTGGGGEVVEFGGEVVEWFSAPVPLGHLSRTRVRILAGASHSRDSEGQQRIKIPLCNIKNPSKKEKKIFPYYGSYEIAVY